MSESQALVLYNSTNLEALDDFDEAVIEGKRVEILDDPREIEKVILRQLQAAQSDFELEPREAIGWQKLLGVPMEIRGFSWLPSDEKYVKEGGSTVYCATHATNLESGEPVVLTTGSKTVLIQLSNLAKRRRFPCVRAMAERERPTQSGFHPLTLYTPEGYAQEQETIEDALVEEIEVES